MTIQMQKCQRCGYEWYPRSTKQPKRCAKCRSPYWNKPKVKQSGPRLDLPHEKGYHGARLRSGVRVQARRVNFGMEDILDQTGTIKQIRKKYALVIFDQPVRNRNDWLLPFNMLGYIKKKGGDKG